MLDRITNKNPKHQEFGWKVFARRDEGKLESEYYNWCVDIKVGRWLKAKSSIIHRDYKVGFHCFKTETGAKWYREISHDRDILEVRKVRMRGVRLEGKQFGAKVLVCDYIYILDKDGNEPPPKKSLLARLKRWYLKKEAEWLREIR
jgi:hypothetical protein